MKVLAKFRWDWGRMGSVQSLFVCEASELDESYGRYVSFGDILGKHSDVSGIFDRGAITIASTDQDFITKLVAVLGSENISGHNPLEHIRK